MSVETSETILPTSAGADFPVSLSSDSTCPVGSTRLRAFSKMLPTLAVRILSSEYQQKIKICRCDVPDGSALGDPLVLEVSLGGEDGTDEHERCIEVGDLLGLAIACCMGFP